MGAPGTEYCKKQGVDRDVKCDPEVAENEMRKVHIELSNEEVIRHIGDGGLVALGDMIPMIRFSVMIGK